MNECVRMRIVVLSDTHLRPWRLSLPPAVLSAAGTADCIVHAGDLTCVAVYQQLTSLALTHAVRGNVDDPELRAILPRTRVFEVCGKQIGLVHGDGAGGPALRMAKAAFSSKDGPRVDCVIFGHSHMPYCERVDGVLYLNPGSPTDPRRSPGPSYAVLSVDGDVDAEIVWI